jgi:hypothetical protein
LKSLLGLAILLILISSFASFASSQTSSSPTVFFTHHYIVTSFGDALMNESITYTNTSPSGVQIPAVQLGIPGNISSHQVGNVTISPTGQFAFHQSTLNSTNVFTVSPIQPTLQPNSTSKFTLQIYLRGIATASTSNYTVLVLATPSVNINVTKYRFLVQLPPFTSFPKSIPGFASGNNNTIPFYEKSCPNKTNSSLCNEKQPLKAQFLKEVVSPRGSTGLQPIHVFVASRTITASGTGNPQVKDSFIVKNTGLSSLSSLSLRLLSTGTTVVTVLPSTYPPLVNPTVVTLIGGTIQFSTKPFGTPIGARQNFSFTILYDLPNKYYTVSGGDVKVRVPDSPPIAAPVDKYTIQLIAPSGIKTIKSSPLVIPNVTPLTNGQVSYEFSLAIGWAADQAIPIASFVFLIVFALLAVSRQKAPVAEEGETPLTERVGGMIRAFEEKINAVNQVIEELSTAREGELSKIKFDEDRAKLDSFRAKALQRLNEAKQKSTSRKLYDLMNEIHESEREADKAAKDLVNLYEQHYFKRMRDETFERLLPSYKKRLNRTLNQLSDRLNLAQREAKVG